MLLFRILHLYCTEECSLQTFKTLKTLKRSYIFNMEENTSIGFLEKLSEVVRIFTSLYGKINKLFNEECKSVDLECLGKSGRMTFFRIWYVT